jgi:hypothetical protein
VLPGSTITTSLSIGNHNLPVRSFIPRVESLVCLTRRHSVKQSIRRADECPLFPIRDLIKLASVNRKDSWLLRIQNLPAASGRIRDTKLFGRPSARRIATSSLPRNRAIPRRRFRSR